MLSQKEIGILLLSCSDFSTFLFGDDCFEIGVFVFLLWKFRCFFFLSWNGCYYDPKIIISSAWWLLVRNRKIAHKRLHWTMHRNYESQSSNYHRASMWWLFARLSLALAKMKEDKEKQNIELKLKSMAGACTAWES